MSLVVSWIAVHDNGASLYLASDSRISWGDAYRWDHAQKVFASPKTGELFGYAGDVLFPTQTLSQICQITQTGVLFSSREQPEARVDRYAKIMTEALASYPPECLAEPFDVLYACYTGGVFSMFRISYTAAHKVIWAPLELPKNSGLVDILGSGKLLMEQQYREAAPTSYGVFHALANVIDSRADLRVGGIPQVVSLYSDARTNVYGISYRKIATLLGLQVSCPGVPSAVEWRNEDFELWDPVKNSLKQGAQRQPRLVRKTRGLLP